MAPSGKRCRLFLPIRNLPFIVASATVLCLVLSDFDLVFEAVTRHIEVQEQEETAARIWQQKPSWQDKSPQQDQKPVVYSHLRKDRSGWVIMDMLKAHAFAWERNATYGGACGESLHKHDIQNILDTTGLHNILSFACPPNVTARNDNHLQRHVLYQGSVYETGSAKRLASNSWKKDIQRHLLIDGTTKSKNVTAVVVHIRRGDVTPCCYPAWYVPNAYFSAMIEKYSSLAKRQFPAKNVQIQIFSQKDSFESWSPFRQYQLHLDSDIGQVWKSILNADYFIGSKSEFSRVPAMFTRGKVVNEHDEWVPYKKESQKVFTNCSETTIFSCKHKWWQTNKRKGKK
jgi:hypothetical protein